MVDSFPAPIQEVTTDPDTKRFPQVWSRWFEDISGIITSLNSGGVTSVNGQTGVAVLDAGDIGYDNTSSGLVATDVQAAIDEVSSAAMVIAEYTSNTTVALEDIVFCTGTFTVTLPNPAAAPKRVTVRNISGSTTIATVSGTIEITSLTVGQSTTLAPRSTGWFEI